MIMYLSECILHKLVNLSNLDKLFFVNIKKYFKAIFLQILTYSFCRLNCGLLLIVKHSLSQIIMPNFHRMNVLSVGNLQEQLFQFV